MKRVIDQQFDMHKKSKCQKLEELGFTVHNNQDYDVTFKIYSKIYNFDFSATANDHKSLMYMALALIAEQAKKEGVEHLRSDLKSLLDL